MEDRKNRIDEFLKFFRDIAIQNPNLFLTKNEVYNELTRLGVPNSEKETRIDINFRNWEDYYQKNKNCEVFVDPYWPYFCQFISTDSRAKRAKEHIKVYIPLDSEHIQIGAKEIFNFLSSRGISHLSKIGSDVRFDDIVIRLINPSDLDQLINYLNNNKYIQEGLMPANPFLFNVNGIPLAVDGHISFNSTIASLIAMYINDKKSKNELNNVSVDDFYKFIGKYYETVFSSEQGLKKLSQDFKFNYSIDTIINYKNVFELMMKYNNPNFTLSDYLTHYKECSDLYLLSKQYDEIDTIILKEISNEKIESTNQTLLKIIDVMVQKYNDKYGVLNSISNYLKTGDSTYLTSTQNIRDDIENSSFRDDLNSILKQKNIKFMDYADTLLLSRQKSSSSTSENMSIVEKESILVIKEILLIMGNKYGEEVAINNISKYIETADPTYLTRTNNLREKVVNSDFRKNIKTILEQKNITLQEFLIIIGNVADINPNEVILESAILATYDKYEAKYEQGISEYTGQNFIECAIAGLLRGEYFGFTRDGGSRQKLQDNVTPNEVCEIIEKTLNLPNNFLSNISNEQLSSIISQYVDIVIKKNKQKKM